MDGLIIQVVPSGVFKGIYDLKAGIVEFPKHLSLTFRNRDCFLMKVSMYLNFDNKVLMVSVFLSHSEQKERQRDVGAFWCLCSICINILDHSLDLMQQAFSEH